MNISGDVLNASIEERDLVNKEGVKNHAKISHVLMSIKGDSGGVEIVNLRAYDADWPLPEIGKKWTTPRVKRYECFDGQVADVSV